jgi:hypothetical protein
MACNLGLTYKYEYTGASMGCVSPDHNNHSTKLDREEAMADPKSTRLAADGSRVDVENIIDVAMEDLSEKDRNDLELELQREIEEVMAERRKKKLACFQKIRGGAIKKGDTAKARPINSPFTLEELVHMIDVSVNRKYGVDLEGITHTLMDSLQGVIGIL